MSNLRELLKISEGRLAEVNDLLTDPANETVGQILQIVEKYGGPEEINRKAAEAGKFENLMARLKEIKSPYIHGQPAALQLTGINRPHGVSQGETAV